MFRGLWTDITMNGGDGTTENHVSALHVQWNIVWGLHHKIQKQSKYDTECWNIFKIRFPNIFYPCWGWKWIIFKNLHNWIDFSNRVGRLVMHMVWTCSWYFLTKSDRLLKLYCIIGCIFILNFKEFHLNPIRSYGITSIQTAALLIRIRSNVFLPDLPEILFFDHFLNEC